MIDEHAPVVARAEVAIDAAPEHVWEVLTAIDRWPSWNHDVKAATLEGPLVAGTQFRWKGGPGTITSTLREVDAPRTLEWTGRTLGIAAVHAHRLEPRDGKTVVHSEESWSGVPVRLLRRRTQRVLEASLARGLDYLKREVERRAQP